MGRYGADLTFLRPFFTFRPAARHRIAVVSATHDLGVGSMVNQRSLKLQDPTASSAELWAARKQLRRLYCAIHHCDAVWDTTQYHQNRTMLLHTRGGAMERGPMPPYWNKAFVRQL